jgi:hypothetical protein
MRSFIVGVNHRIQNIKKNAKLKNQIKKILQAGNAASDNLFALFIEWELNMLLTLCNIAAKCLVCR